MAKYRLVEHKGKGWFYFTIEQKKFLFWTNPFKTKHNLGRFASKDDALKALVDILPFEKVVKEE